MATLSELLKAVKNDLPITVRHDQWLTRNANAKYSTQAIEFARKALSHQVGGNRDRISSFRSSGTGSCHRRQVFRFLNFAEHQATDAGTSNIFHTGNMLHLKWQMAGLTEGWLVEAEVACMNEDLRFGGTLDGILYDGSGFEFKSINSRGWSSVMNYGVKEEHLLQVHAYMVLRPEIEKFSVVYENKDNGEWREFRIQKDEEHYRQVRGEIDQLNHYIDRQQLPVMLPDCEKQEGRVFRQCPYREICPATKSLRSG